MFPCAGLGYGLWWIFPLIMVVMMVLCFFMMKGRMGSMMCRPGIRRSGGHGEDASDKRISGEISNEESKIRKES